VKRPNRQTAARIIGAPWWPLAVLAVSVGLFQIGGGAASARLLPVPVSLVAGLCIAAAAWWLADLGIDRLHLPLVVILGAGALGIVAVAIAVPPVAGRVLHLSPVLGRQAGLLAAEAATVGLGCRAWFGHRARGGQLVVAWAVISWVQYLNFQVGNHPFRDLELYLIAGHRFLHGLPVYITSLPPTVPGDPALLPFVYPPFTLPFFAALAALPHVAAIAIFEAMCVAAVAGGLRLIGVRWSFVPLLLLWPPLAIGIQVGNVACFSFLVLAAAWSVPEVIPLGGVFKPQTGLMALWLVRERRLRTLAVGLGGLALGIIATLPLTGIAIYGEWLRSLGLFQDWLVIHPGVMAFALQRSFGGLAAAGIAVVVVIVALLAGGRDGLARIAIGATASSPTVYVHGFSLVLPSILFLDAASAWAVLALAPWGRVFWPAVALVLLALALGLTRTRLAGAGPGDGEPTPGERDDSRLHPLGGLPVPWPDRPVKRPVPLVR
jgi:hypothetical protein